MKVLSKEINQVQVILKHQEIIHKRTMSSKLPKKKKNFKDMETS